MDAMVRSHKLEELEGVPLMHVYHGTNRENAESILEEGFKENTWFAVNLQDALEFGGSKVFMVEFAMDHVMDSVDIEQPVNKWKFRMIEDVPYRICNLKSYMVEKLSMENEGTG